MRQRKAHYVTAKGLLCHQAGCIFSMVIKVADVTCKRCLKKLQRGIQTELRLQCSSNTSRK